MRRVASVVVVVVVYTEFDNTIEINRTFESENQVQNYRSTRVIISEYILLYNVSMKRRAQLTYMLCVCVRVLYYYINMKLFDYIYVFTYIYIYIHWIIIIVLLGLYSCTFYNLFSKKRWCIFNFVNNLTLKTRVRSAGWNNGYRTRRLKSRVTSWRLFTC